MAKPGSVIGWLLAEDDRERLLEQYKPKYEKTVAHHVTLKTEAERDPLPHEVRAQIVGRSDDESGVEANVIVQQGDPVRTVRDYIGERSEVAALVLGASPSGSPGPLVAYFTGNDAGKLPCPVMIIPGSLSDERLEQLS